MKKRKNNISSLNKNRKNKIEMTIFTLLLFGFLFSISHSASANGIVTYLEPDEIVDYTPETRRVGFLQNELRIYCYRGAEKSLSRYFEIIELQFNIADDDYKQYEGETPTEVRTHYDEQRSLFSFNIFTQKRTRLQISPFGQHCIGLETTQAYSVKLQQIRIDFWRVIQLAIGISLFVYAGGLSNNAAFYYMVGIAIGICSSFMLLIWLAGKLVPKRPVMYGVVIGGWAVGAYILQMLWDNIRVILITYKSYVFWYILTTGLISFLFCYRWGPPKNKRSKNIIKWTLQFFGLIFIYISSYFEEATVAVMILTAIVYYFPRSLFGKLNAYYLRFFPPRRRLLTDEEFHEQGVKETTKALDELRKFASSPNCRQWRLMSQLKDPYRFAAFVEGASHLRDEEILDFESSVVEDNDNGDYDDSENEEVNILDNEISEEEDDDHVIAQNNQINRMHLTPNRYLNGSINSRNYTTSPRYASTYDRNYADVSSSQQRRDRAAYMVNAATTSTYRQSSRSSRSRPPITHSDSED